MAEKLKPCPFCGGKAEIKYKTFYEYYKIRCSRCKIVTYPTKFKEESIENWNRRV